MNTVYPKIFRKNHGRLKSVFFRRILRLIIGGVAGVLPLWLGYGMILQPDLFRLRHIEVSETFHIRSQKIRAIFEPVLQHNLLTLDLLPFIQEVSDNPWVQEVRIRKVLPDTLMVHVQERTPAAVVESQKGLHWVDPTGVVLGSAQDRSGLFPRIRGIPLDGLVRQDIDPLRRLQTGLALIGLVQDLHGIGVASTSTTALQEPIVVDLSHGSRDPRLYLQGYRLRIGDGAYEEKWRSFLAIQSDLKARGLAHEEIDLRFVDQVIVKTF